MLNKIRIAEYIIRDCCRIVDSIYVQCDGKLGEDATELFLGFRELAETIIEEYKQPTFRLKDAMNYLDELEKLKTEVS